MVRSGQATLDSRLAAAQAINARGQHHRASRAFEEIVREVDAAGEGAGRGDAYVAARALLGLALSEFELTGDVDGAYERLAEVEERGAVLAMRELAFVVRSQRGLLRLRSGDVTAALVEMETAVDVVDDARPLDAAVLMLNLGSLRLELGDAEGASRDLDDAVRRGSALGDDLLVSKARHNLGYAEYLRGDLPVALRAMDEAAEQAPDRHAAVGLIDRAQVLLDAGLLTEADDALGEARAQLSRYRMLRDLAEVELVRSRVVLGLRRYADARRLARSASRRFDRLGNAPWMLRARVAELQAALTEHRADAVTPTTARRHATWALDLAREGETLGGVAGLGVTIPAQLLAAEWLVSAGDVPAARDVLALVPARLDRAPLPVRLQHEAVLAQLAFAAGDRRGGVRAVRRGQSALAEHRARLGSVDAVTASAVHGVRLGNVDVDAALRTRRPGTIFDAVERGRAAFAGTGRVRPPSDPVLADLLASARREVEAARALGAPSDPAYLARRQDHLRAARRLQDDARRRAWQHGGGAATPVAATERRLRAGLSAAGSDAVVADLVLDGDDVRAVRVSAEGTRLVRLARRTTVAEQVRRARADFAVLSNVLIPVPMREAAVASLTRTLTALDEALVAPLEADGDLHVAARDLLLALPWASLPSRRGLRTWANSWVDLRIGEPTRRADEALVVAGPGLRFSSAEAKLVASVWEGSDALAGEDATCEAVVDGLRTAGVVHLAAHGTHETDNPLFSSLRLADGPLFAHELDGIDLHGVVVVLSACEVGLSTPRIGGESLGLTSVLLRLGARAVVASVAPLRDDVAARVMPSLHAELRDGAMPGTALARAVADEPEPVPLVCFGPLVL
ncbi:CHAT domain-containing protein [Cellulosimicrobium protaetiae]|uniref:CHAT domain-containing protein n=1 Tax=Cellulosimicrobium protaetiae TaxID=2587808 RepID=A0A6M5UJR3_9MICO|nr:CHAT domain-containing protein [Cellulosimicrobium protaetiae]QJW37595.1 CHAT domain-containing protein [Cellulosimicrobium protaetiae]